MLFPAKEGVTIRRINQVRCRDKSIEIINNRNKKGIRMRNFTLFVLAVLASAVGKAQPSEALRPLAQKHTEVSALQAPKNIKEQPSQETLQRQVNMEAKQGFRAALTGHGKVAAKAGKAVKSTRKRAAGEAIYEQPEGEQVLYNRSGNAYYTIWGYVFNTTLSGAVGNVVFGDGGKVYIKNLVSQAGANTWVEGTLVGTSSIQIQLPQVAMEFPGSGYNLVVAKLKYDSAEQWYVKSSNQTLTLSYNSTTGAISYTSTQEIIGLIYDDDESWSGYADWNISFRKLTDQLTEAPEGLETETYSLAADGYDGSLVQVGFQGSDVYVQGLDVNLPETWVKGTISGDKVTFANKQYIGADEVSGYHQYLVSATAEEVYDQEYDEYYTQYTLADGDITFKYDAVTKTLSESSTFLINGGKTVVNYLSALTNARIAPFTEVAATPATPLINELFEGGYGYYQSGYGWGYLDFDVKTADTEGNYILPEKLTYQLWVKVNGEERPLTLSWWDYTYQEDETLTELPYNYSDGWDIYSTGQNKNVYYYVVGPEAYGVQAIYRGAGEEHRSEIAWAEVQTIGAEVQPDAASPAYPDATIGETDGRIDYSLYTGDEELNTVTNNSKPETYDVAIKIDDPSLVGTLIESITFPLQEVEGVSNLSVFLSSQLRVEGGKNAADIVVKAASPEEPGFVTVTLDKPYTIPEGGVYAGYSLTVDDVEAEEANEAPVVVTDQASEGGLYLHTSDGFLKWLDLGDLFGGSAAITVGLAGENIKANAATVADGEDTYALSGQQTTIPVTVVNHGSNGIQSVELSYTVAGQAGSQTFDVDVSAIYGGKTSVSLTVPAISEKGNHELTITAAKVNSHANEDPNAGATQSLIVLNTLPKKRALLEEYTGFWCGWCPRGYVGLEQLAVQYPDEYILASYHNGDELEIMSSSSFPSQVNGFPAAWMDRAVSLDAYYGTGDKDFGIADDLAQRNKLFGQADLTLTPKLSDDGSSVGITTNVTFPYTLEGGNFTVEYLLLADGLTDPSWGQSNYYAGGNAGNPEYMDAFTQTTDETVYGLPFNDVVVLTSELLYGSGNNITDAEADTPVSLSYSFNLSDAYNTSNQSVIQDTDNLKVVAILINKETGEVVNANKANVAIATGISEIQNPKLQVQGSEGIYNLLGARRQKAVRGVNIFKQADGTVRKAVVK